MDDPMKKALEAAGVSSSSLRRELEVQMQKLLGAIDIPRPSQVQYHLPELRMPEYARLPAIPTQEEVNRYQSAGILVSRLADSIKQWREQLPSDQQPAILAILNGGVQISVERLAEESFHGIRIEGKIADVPCMILAHQATLQLICYIEKVDEGKDRTSIGFVIGGEEQRV